MVRTRVISTGFNVSDRVVTNHDLEGWMETSDEWIRTGQYRRVLLVGTEVHSTGLDVSTEGRDTAVLFGDGAGVAILGPTEDDGRGVLSVKIHADGRLAEGDLVCLTAFGSGITWGGALLRW